MTGFCELGGVNSIYIKYTKSVLSQVGLFVGGCWFVR